jgi:hypothetical protein
MANDAQQAVLGERARRPSLLPSRCEPFVREVMLNVRWIDERDQDIDVEKETDHGNSSRS